MIDLETCYKERSSERPALLEDTDCRRWSSDCTCNVCQKRNVEGPRKLESPFDDYNDIVPDAGGKLTFHMYLLCPSSIYALVFKMRKWGKHLHLFIHSI